MQNFQNNIVIKKGRFSNTPRFDNEFIKNFNFDSGLVSKNISDNFFTNFAKCQTEDCYNEIINYYINSKNNDFSFLFSDFKLAEPIINDYKAKRLLKIISAITKIKYKEKDLNYIYKFNHYRNKIHFFVKKSNNNLKLILIDLYHLGIYGQEFKNGKFMKNSIQKTYKHHKRNNCKLDDIKSLI